MPARSVPWRSQTCRGENAWVGFVGNKQKATNLQILRATVTKSQYIFELFFCLSKLCNWNIKWPTFWAFISKRHLLRLGFSCFVSYGNCPNWKSHGYNWKLKILPATWKNRQAFPLKSEGNRTTLTRASGKKNLETSLPRLFCFACLSWSSWPLQLLSGPHLSSRTWSKAKSSSGIPLASAFSKLLPSCSKSLSFCSSGCESLGLLRGSRSAELSHQPWRRRSWQ